MIQLVCEKQQTLHRFTDDNLAQASFCFTYLLKNKEIKINGKKVGEDVLLNAGDVVSYYMTPKQEQRCGFAIVYEDENVLIVDKESGVNSEAVYAELSRRYPTYCAFIHRLDRNTMGLLAFAKTSESEEELLSAFQKRQVEKRYKALCFGAFSKIEDTMQAYLKKDEEHAQVRVYATKTAGAERIITQYTVLEKRPDGTNLVDVTLHTGKTHQIRAHFSFIGCPVVGDMKYGDTQKNKAKNCTRQQLVAKSLTFSFEGRLSYLNGKTFVSQYDL